MASPGVSARPYIEIACDSADAAPRCDICMPRSWVCPIWTGQVSQVLIDSQYS